MNGSALLSLLLCFLTSPLSGALTYCAGMVVSKNWPAARLASASGTPLLLGPPRGGWSMAGGNCCGPPSPWHPRPLPAAPQNQPPAVADAPCAQLLHIQKPSCRKSSLAGPPPRRTRQRRLLLAPPPQPNTRPYLRVPGTTLHRCNNSVSHPSRLRLLGAPLRPDGPSSDVPWDGTLAARSPPPQEEQPRTPRPTATSLTEQPPLSPHSGGALPPHCSAPLLQRKALQELQMTTPADVSHEERARLILEKKNGLHHTGPLLAPVHRALLTDPRDVSKSARNQVTRSARGALGPVLHRRQPVLI